MFAGKQRRVVRQMLSPNSLELDCFAFFFSGLLELKKAFKSLALTPSKRDVMAV
jgi:hypothetical protein